MNQKHKKLLAEKIGWEFFVKSLINEPINKVRKIYSK